MPPGGGRRGQRRAAGEPARHFVTPAGRRRPRGRGGEGTDQIRAELHCKGLGGAGRRARRRTAARTGQRALVARTAGVERESDVVEFHDQGSTRCASCAAAAVDRRPGP